MVNRARKVKKAGKLEPVAKLSTYRVELCQKVPAYRVVEILAGGANEAAAVAEKEAFEGAPAFRKDWDGREVKAVSVKKVR